MTKYALPRLDFSSDLVATLFEVERLRSYIGSGDIPIDTYVELHQLFDTVMSVISARIEGNHTTVYDALEQIDHAAPSDSLREIRNIAATARFIDTQDPAQPLTHAFIRELHSSTVRGLVREGDPNPGSYREVDVAITNSAHTPPSWVLVHAEMTELLDFANAERPPHEQMLQVALAHHRFVWIHPFRNGNGRVSRLFTYAMLRRTIFASGGHSSLNPTAVFGNDREAYIAALEAADDLSEQGTTTWISFFARGLRDDLARLNTFEKSEYVNEELIRPALGNLRRDGVISSEEEEALNLVASLGVVKAGDLQSALPGSPSVRSRAIGSLIARGLLTQADERPRFYRLVLSSGPLAPRLVRRLDALGYLPRMLSDD